MYRSKYFPAEERQCPCCGDAIDVPTFLRTLDEIRDWLGKPLYISIGGGYRCKKYNEKIGGHKNSAHTSGLAVDIKCTNSVDRYAIIEAAVLHNFHGIGIYDKHIHLDKQERVGRVPVMWTGISK